MYSLIIAPYEKKLLLSAQNDFPWRFHTIEKIVRIYSEICCSFQTRERREVSHYQYVTWPDFGVPSSPITFLNFLMAVRESGVLESDVGPAIIHCSAGIGRSGTFCLVDSCLILVCTIATIHIFSLISPNP